MKRINIWMPQSMAADLMRVSHAQGMTASALVRQVVGAVLEEHIRREQEKRDE